MQSKPKEVVSSCMAGSDESKNRVPKSFSPGMSKKKIFLLHVNKGLQRAFGGWSGDSSGKHGVSLLDKLSFFGGGYPR